MQAHQIDQLNQLISEFTVTAGLDPISLSDKGQCSFAFDQETRFDIALSDDGESVYLIAEIRPLPERGLGPTLNYYMTENYVGIRTRGASFAIDESRNAIVLNRSLQLEQLNSESFTGYVCDFLEVVGEYQNKQRSGEDGNTIGDQSYGLQNKKFLDLFDKKK